MRVTEPVSLGSPHWMPDGRRLVIARGEGTKPRTGLIVPLDGGTPTPLQLDSRLPAGSYFLAIHPDGRRVAFSQGETAHEVRTVEIAVPAPRR